MNCEPCEPCEPCVEHCVEECLPPLDVCLLGILEAFERHASTDDDHLTLSKKELKGMLQEEIGPMMEEGERPRRLAQLFTRMDHNGDKKMDFPEFMTALGVFACIIHNRLCRIPDEPGTLPPERCGTFDRPERCGPSLPANR